MTTYKLRIGDYGVGAVKDVDYLEFYADGDPMPTFTQGRTNNYNEDGTLISINYEVNLRLYYPCHTNEEIWQVWHKINDVMSSGNHDIRLYYGDNDDDLVTAFIKGSNAFNTPRIEVLQPTEGRGQWATYLEFTAQIFIETTGAVAGVLELDRQKETTNQDGRITRRWSITARGAGAAARVAAFGGELAQMGRLTMRSVTQNVDKCEWSGTYTIEDASQNNILEFREAYRVRGGGREVEFLGVHKDGLPYKFSSPLLPVEVEITGNITVESADRLLIPNRDDLPGHVPLDEFSYGSAEADADGDVSQLRGSYRQIFKLAGLNGLDQILKMPRTLKTVGDDARQMLVVVDVPTEEDERGFLWANWKPKSLRGV